VSGKLSYNERLWRGGLRRWLHNSRFLFLQHCLTGIPYESVFELGCFDGRAIGFMPICPKRYIGADAGWEGGLSIARQQYPQYEFLQASKAADIRNVPPVDITISLETLEHIPEAELLLYLDELQRITKNTLVVSVPIEFGPVFLIKHLVKRLVPGFAGMGDDRYTFLEIVWATIGRTSKVKRDEHKGFDYRSFCKLLERNFTVLSVKGLPFSWLPAWLNFGCGIISRPKRAADYRSGSYSR
jgi:hypothetical protein